MGGGFATSITAEFSTTRPTVYQELERSGSCRRLAAEPSFCRPICVGFCVGQSQCLPFPERLAAGTVTLSGLARPVAIEPITDNVYQHFANEPMLQDGATITASAPGGEFGSFKLTVKAPEPLVLTNYNDLALRSDRQLTFTWTASDRPDARIRLFLRSDLAHGIVHPAIIECDAPDNGSLTISADWIDWFSDAKHWGCGDCFESTIRRYTSASTDVDGTTLELFVASAVPLYLTPGI